MPEIWNGLVMDVSNSVPGSNTLKFYDVVSVIISKEIQRKRTSETSGNVFTMERRGRQRERGKIPGNHRKYRKGRYKYRLGNKEWSNYGKRGHLKKGFEDRKKKGDKKQESTQEENVAGDVLQDSLILA